MGLMRSLWMALGLAAVLGVGAATWGQAGPATTAPEPLTPIAARVYNADLHDSKNAEQSGAAAMTIVGARNGSYSGKVVVTGRPLAGLTATASELVQPTKGPSAGARPIPVDRVKVRYGVAWPGNQKGSSLEGTDVLLEKPLAEFAGDKVAVWVTVQVPKDAAVGVYTGVLTIRVQGGGPFQVPVSLTVQDWTLPDTQDYRTWMEVIQSPDTLALEYKLTPWSEEHFQKIGQSLKLIGSIGSRVVYIPLICHANFGNEESMVRWIKKGNGYEQDYSIMEKYLDAVEKNMGKPKIVTLWAWDVHVMKADAGKRKEAVTLPEANGGPPVTVYDPATKKSELVWLAPYESPEGKAQWAPVWKELKARLEKRGLWQAAMLGVSSDIWPSKEQTQALADLSGGLNWSSSTHDINWLAPQVKSGQGALHGIGTIAYINSVLQFEMTINPSLPNARTYGWQRPQLVAQYWRLGQYNRFSLPDLRSEPTCIITGDRRGLGHIGGDFWPTLKSRSGRGGSMSVSTRYPESLWHSQAINCWLLAPGQDGPVATARFEVMREGVQECEARIAIEAILTDPAKKARVGAALAQRAVDFLDEHQRNAWRACGALEEDFQKHGHVPYYRTFEYEIRGYPKFRWNQAAGAQRFYQSKWPERVGELFKLAGEVTKKAG